MKMKHTPIALPVETSALLAAWLSVQPPPVFEGLGKVSSWRPESLSVAGILGTPYAFLFHQHGQSVRNVDHRKKDQEWSTRQGPTNSSALATWDVDTPKVYLMLWQEGEIAPHCDLWQDILGPLPALIFAFFFTNHSPKTGIPSVAIGCNFHESMSFRKIILRTNQPTNQTKI